MTATDPATSTDLPAGETLPDISSWLDDEVPCDIPECQAPATHRLRPEPCGHPALPGCLPHAEEAAAHSRKMHAAGYQGRCHRCGAVTTGVVVVPL